MTQQVETTANVAVDEASCLLIDGQALVMAIGTLPGIKTFGDFANIFTEAVFKMETTYRETWSLTCIETNPLNRGK